MKENTSQPWQEMKEDSIDEISKIILLVLGLVQKTSKKVSYK